MPGRVCRAFFYRMIIFLDIDGTLIDEKDHSMPESTKQAIAQARKNGHICMINTGRAGSMVGPEIRDLVELDGFVMGCGTMIEYAGRIIFHKTFSVAEAEEIITGLRKYRIDAVLEGSEVCFCDAPKEMNTDEFGQFVTGWMKLGYARDTVAKAPGHFDKFYCYMGDKDLRDGFMQEFGDRLDFVDRERGYYEVTPKGFSKASGIRTLAKLLEIPMEETAAVGDSNNDLSMLECAQYAIGMGKSSQRVKEIADFITTDIQQDGIRNAFRWLGVI
ncbi:MAG: HAD family hydrolase [Lachnospiraceae bacterium]|nr:HAD family hydrolase [Lachnospiraceae bacterium]